MFDIPRELPALPAGSDSDCEIAERFISEWFGPIPQADGYDSEQIESAERVLGFSLPPTLRWLYAKVGRRLGRTRRLT